MSTATDLSPELRRAITELLEVAVESNDARVVVAADAVAQAAGLESRARYGVARRNSGPQDIVLDDDEIDCSPLGRS